MSEQSRSHSENKPDNPSRWRYLGLGSAVGTLTLAGCSGNDTPADTESLVPAENEQPTSSCDKQSTRITSSQARSQGSIDKATRERVAQLGEEIRPSVALLETDGSLRPVVGVFLDTSLVVTSGVALKASDGISLQSVQTADGKTEDATIIGRTTVSEKSQDIAAVRVDIEAPVLPGGSAGELSPGDIVVQVGYTSALEWVTQFGRVKGFTADGRFMSSLPFQTPGGPVVTLDGELVGITTQSGEMPSSGSELPPPTAPETVYTDSSQWRGVRQEPIGDILSQVHKWTA